MDFDLSNEQRKRLAEIEAAVSAELAGDGDEPFSRARWQAAARAGLTGLCLPAEHGGGGLGALDTALALETFGHACPDTGLVFAVSAHLLAGAVPIRDFARDDVREELLPGLADGSLIAANAMTEDGAGSDVRGIRTAARRDGDDYVLDGEKSFVSNGPAADVFIVYAVTDPTAGFLGQSVFAVPTDRAGLRVSEPFDKLGLRSCPAGRVTFDGCRVPARFLLGEEGQGSAVFQHSMGWERACLPAGYLGLLDRQLDRSIAHAREREQFGRAIGGFQAVSHRIVGMYERIEAARQLLYRACWSMDAGRDAVPAAALSKIAVSEAAVANSVDALQVLGARGYRTGSGAERELRDAIPSTVFSGTTEIQRELIARRLGL